LTTEFSKFECVNQWPEILQIKCHINRTSRNISALYGEFKFWEDVNNIKGNYLVGVEYNKNFINYTAVELDYCAALHTAYSQTLLQVVAVGLRSVSNFPHSCPFKKNKTYFVNGFTMDPKIVPVYMPNLSFITNATIFYNRRAVFYVTCFGRIVKK
ncbi:hypothetical protein KR215_003648, partial [Drosophila sulfurigaster]